MINYIKDLIDNKILKRDSLKRTIFAVSEGSYKGEFFVYINKTDETFYFLSLPNNDPVQISVKDFTDGLDKKIIEPIEKLPSKVYEICVAQYNEAKAKDNINRLKQPSTSSGVDKRKSKNRG